ncbi:MAG: hypothetical protein CEE42_02895 [Promethearchaeota archaeon Loki_b31]|nr:MAG: hypothetical protein CEE42_02895 [Candidatus Lokiarchaeota archaeon Loki_b31]
MVKTQKPVGIVDGKFYPCPNTPNCVSTQATDAKHKISPISYSGTMSEAKEKIIKILNSLKRTKIITNTENYIHAEVRTATFKFVDDVEFLFDDSEKIIQFRSRARSGHSDMGVNRKRMEKIREMFIDK